MLAWGPPHNPYFDAPEKYRALYDPDKLTLLPNVSRDESNVRKSLSGYYAHCSALDDCVGDLRRTLEENGVEKNTILVFTSDHGDMLGSHGMQRKQKPYDESIRVPLIVHWPAGIGTDERVLEAPITPEDFMPTLLGMCGVKIPKSVEGLDFSSYLRGGKAPGDRAALILCPAPFGEWDRKHGGREFRGIRTAHYTYVRDLKGPWLLFDNEADPFQTNNLVNAAAHAKLQKELDSLLKRKLKKNNDKFLPAEEYIRKWGYLVDENGTVPYTP